MAEPRGRMRRILRWTGVLMILAGLACASWVGWELYGTTWVAKRDQDRTVAATERVWSTGPDTPSGPVSEDEQALAEGVVALVRIPAFGEDYVVPVREGTSEDVLEGGFGLFDGSPGPGEAGNYALGGHRVTNGEPLRRMPELEPGDVVEVTTKDTIYTYTLDTAGDALTVGYDEPWVLAPDPAAPGGGEPVSRQVGSRRLLSLVTCAELFNTDDRLVAFGHLTDQRPA